MKTRPTCRPRVEGEREGAILDATLTLLLEVGYDRLSLDAVSRRARAGKATLYRRWQGKASLVVDAIARARRSPVGPPADTGSLRGDLLAAFAHGLGGGEATQVLGSVLTALASDPEFAALFREAVVAPRLEASREIFRRAVERGEIARGLDLEIIAPAMAGILMHRSYVLGQAPDDATLERVVDHVVLPAVGLGRGARGTSPKPSTGHPSASPSVDHREPGPHE